MSNMSTFYKKSVIKCYISTGNVDVSFDTIMQNKLTKLLEELGLSQNEALVYLSALSFGPGTVLKIARASDMKRTTVYSVIEALKQKGLMTIEMRGLKQLFVAENPEKLEAIINNKKNQLDKKMPELAALYNLRGGESVVKYYEGIESVKSVYESMIRDIAPEEDYMVIGDNVRWYELDPDFFEKFLHKRARLDINIRLLLEDSPVAQEHKKREHIYNEKIKLLPKRTKLTTNLVMIPRRMMLHQLIPPITATVIESRSAIQMQQEMFEIMWDALPD